MASGFRAVRLGTIWLLAAVAAAIVVSHLSIAAPTAPALNAREAPAAQAPLDIARTGQLSSRFGRQGVTLSVGGARLMTLDLSAVGRSRAMRAVSDVTREAGRNSVRYISGGLTQSYTDRQGGLEQVFRIAHRLGGSGQLKLVVGRLAPGVRAVLSRGSLDLFGRGGHQLASYGELRVTDARGAVVPSRMVADDGRLLLLIGDRAARYPLRVDPYVHIAQLTPSSADSALGTANGARGLYGSSDTFGTSITESANGDVVVIGAPDDDSAFVYVKPAHGGWKNGHPTARLKTDVTGQYPELGDSVAVSADGKTIVVGEPHTTDQGVDIAGEALVYTEPSDGWSHTTGHPKAVLFPANPTDYGNFGAAVAIDGGGDTIVVGAPGFLSEAGALYLFKRPASGWASTAGQVAGNVGEPGSNSDYGGLFGMTVSMSSSGNVIAVGASGASSWKGAVYVFGHDLQGYHELPDTASGTADQYFLCSGGGYGVGNPELGSSVAVSDNGKTIVAGEPCAGQGGQAVVYDEPSHGWSTASGNITGGLTPLRPDVFSIQQLGTSVAIAGNGSTIVADDPAYARTGGYLATFRRPRKGWGHINPPVADNFGSVLTPDHLAGGLYLLAQGTPLAVSDGGGNLFVGSTGNNNDGAVDVYELASDIGSATTVSCSPSSINTGKSATCTATVKTNTPTPTGRVSFKSTGGSAGSFNHSGCTLSRLSSTSATCHVSFTPQQRMSYTITARYGGDNNHGSGAGTTVVDTPRDGTTTKVSCAPNPVTAVSKSVCTVIVTGRATHNTGPSLTISPAVANQPTAGACTQTVQGNTEVCSFGLTIPASGTYTVTAAFAGDSLDAPSDASTKLAVDAAVTATTVVCSPATIFADQTSACTANVSGIVGTAAAPPVVFSANGTGWSFAGEACATAGATETCSATFTPGLAGAVKVDASFAGNAGNTGSGGEVGLTVDSTVVLVCAGTDTWFCTTTVTDHRSAPTAPTGTITLNGGHTGSASGSLGSCNLTPGSSSSALCTLEIQHPGMNVQWTLTASYPGDGVHRSGSDTITFEYP
jgi:hypothetical protein